MNFDNYKGLDMKQDMSGGSRSRVIQSRRKYEGLFARTERRVKQAQAQFSEWFTWSFS